MALSLPTIRASLSVSKRWLPFVAAIGLGASAGSGWPLAASLWGSEGQGGR